MVIINQIKQSLSIAHEGSLILWKSDDECLINYAGCILRILFDSPHIYTHIHIEKLTVLGIISFMCVVDTSYLCRTIGDRIYVETLQRLKNEIDKEFNRRLRAFNEGE